MKKIFGYVVFVIVVCFVVPIHAHAYFTTAQSAEVLDGGKGVLYTVTYNFGTEKYDMYMPIIPVRLNRPDALSYTFVDEKTNTPYTNGRAVGIVLSGAQIKDGAYFIPKGTSQKLTLMVLLALPQSAQKPEDLALQVTGLPFKMVAGSKSVDAQLNQYELQYYRTPAVTSLSL